MSYDLMVYIREADPPSFEELAPLLPEIRFLRPLDLRRDRGFFPLALDNAETGFEIGLSTITQADIDGQLEDLEDGDEVEDEVGDTVIQFACHDDVQIRAARKVAEAIAALCHGTVADPQEGYEMTF